MKKLMVYFAIILLLTSLFYVFVIIDRGNKIKDLQEQVEMQELYYELKMNYYEERYGVDLDDMPEDFKKFLYDNYRELYDYLEEMKWKK